MPHLRGVPGRDVGANRVDASEAAGAEQFVGEGEVVLAEALRAGLIDAPVAFGGCDHGLAFRDGHAGGFLRIHVLAGPQGVNGHPGVPVVGGADGDYLDFLSFKEFPVVFIDSRLAIFEGGIQGFGMFAVHVAHRHDVPVGFGGNGIAVALAPVADAAYAHPFIGRGHHQVNGSRFPFGFLDSGVDLGKQDERRGGQ